MQLMPLSEWNAAENQLAVAIMPGAFGAHIGVAYTAEGGQRKVLHLQWHMKLENQAIPVESGPRWIAVPIAIPPIACKQVVAIVRAVAATKPAIGYGLHSQLVGHSFDQSGNYTPVAGSDGLTCATFVYELFAGCAVKLIDLTTWKPTLKGFFWGNDVYQLLEKKQASVDHLKAVRRNINGLRLHPLEIAAAASSGPKAWPLDYQVACSGADRVEVAARRYSSVRTTRGFVRATIQSLLGKQDFLRDIEYF